MELIVVGLNHRTAGIELRERVAFTPAEAEETLRVPLGDREPIFERMLLSTCNRTEMYALAEGSEPLERHFRALVQQKRGVDLAAHADSLYRYCGESMVGHLFRVASSIDSMVVGEVQILGQVHEAFEIARRAGTAGPLFHRLLEAAFRVGKRVRTETEIGSGAVSVSFAAVALASRIFSDMGQQTALLIGSGETGALAARHLCDQGIGELLVTNRTPEHAASLAGMLGGRAIPFAELEGALTIASIVVSATASPVPIVRYETVKRALAARGNRPLLILDIAVPRDVEPAVRDLPNVFLYDVDSLQDLVQKNLERRAKEIPKVESIIRHETEQYLRWYESLGAAPILKALRDRFEEVRAQEVERFGRKFCEKDREQLDALTRGIVNKLLHEPSVRIRGYQRLGPDGFAPLETIRHLFGLGGHDGNAG
ncbi:MAG: glutamyl-tRNA reductase [Candidatus Eisenbacteria bacterium]